MGRLDHLNRLSLGRSAFRPLETEPPTTEVLATSLSGQQRRVQHYDAKGRPRNAATEKLNAELRAAQNKILELVNIVERKTTSPPSSAQPSRHNCMGDVTAWSTFVLMSDIATCLVTWYPETLLQRSLLGAYRSSTPFAQIIAEDYHRIDSGFMSVLLPGFGLGMANAALCSSLYSASQSLVGSAAHFVTTNWTSFNTESLVEAMSRIARATIQLSLLPMLHLATSARLGLVQPKTMLSASSFLAGYYRLCCTAMSRLAWSRVASTALALSVVMLDGPGTRLTLAEPNSRHQLSKHPSLCDPHLTRLTQIVSSISCSDWTIQRYFHQCKAITADNPHNSTCLLCCCCCCCLRCRTKVHRRASWFSPLLLNALPRRLFLQLPLDLMIVQSSARAFTAIVGPIVHSGLLNELPSAGFFHGDSIHANNTISRGSHYLAMLSKAGLAIGMSLLLEVTARGCFHLLASTLNAASAEPMDARDLDGETST